MDVNAIAIMNKALGGEEGDTITRQHLLATLQKMSLRRKIQEKMIDLDLIEWIVDRLRDPER